MIDIDRGARQAARIVELLGPPLVRYPSGGPHRGAHLVYTSTGTPKHGSWTFTAGKVAVSVLFRVDGDGNIEGVDDGPVPPVTVDTDGELWRWLS